MADAATLEYIAQLESFLADDPDNEEIKLALEQLRIAAMASDSRPEAPAGQLAEDEGEKEGPGAENEEYEGQQNELTEQIVEQKVEDTHEDVDQEEYLDGVGEIAANYDDREEEPPVKKARNDDLVPTEQPSSAVEMHVEPRHLAKIGRTCRVIFERVPVTAVAMSMRVDPTGEEKVNVKFIGEGILVEVGGEQRVYSEMEYRYRDVFWNQPPPSHLLLPGSKLQGIWQEDGLWYPVTLKAATKEGFLVHFDGFAGSDAKQELPADWLRVPKEDKKAAEEKKEKEYQTEAGYRIPESLKILETDTADKAEAKRRKIVALKKEQRSERKKKELESSKKGWQNWVKKAEKKKVHSVAQSIFKTPDADDGMAGVCGRGAFTKEQQRLKYM